MLPFFTEPYPNELIYSTIGRYHFYSGNIDYKDTLEEVFQSRSVIPSVEIGSHLSAVTQQIGNHYSVEKLLAKHTIYPFYAPFLSKKRQREIMQDVLGDGKGLYSRLGMIAGSVCKKDGLYYCPLCAMIDINKYGEPYIHREHQLQGIDLCAHHYLQLKKYPIDFSIQSRIEFIRFDKKRINFSTLQEIEFPDYFDIQVELSRMAYQLLNVDIEAFSRQDVFGRYRKLLREKGLVTTSNRVRQKELFQAFQQKFPEGFLEKYESGLEEENEYNWLKVLTRNIKRHVHPFRHLLFLYFLDQNMELFLQLDEDVGPFGKGPWPCLNKAADHYMQLLIEDVVITRDYKSAAPVGTFKCPCGFIYSRKGPDKSSDDYWRIGRVKVFGDTWNNKLQELVANENLSIRKMAKQLGVDSKTIKKYISIGEQKKECNNKTNHSILKEHQRQLLAGIQRYPHYSRTQIRELYSKEYIYLYRHDKEWLFTHIPKQRVITNFNTRVDWLSRDEDYYNSIYDLYKKLMAYEKPIRITKSLIGKRLGILANIEKQLHKLPKTKNLLNQITESVQQFQIRRCCNIIDQMIKRGESISLWRVQRIGAVKSHDFQQIKSQLKEYIRMKQEVKRNEQTS